MDVGIASKRMGARPPLKSRPVRDRDTIRSLIVVAAAMLDGERRGRSFTFSALIEKMRELLERGSVLDAVDVRATLPETGPHLTRTWTGYRWNRRAVYSTVTA
jgi:hypothetical protein